MRVKKILRRIVFFLLGFVALILLVIAFLLNFVFTPEKITPQAVKVINENLNARVSCESIELTFFSSFPFFGLALKNGHVLAAVHYKGRIDTLAQFRECRLSFNAMRLWKQQSLDVRNLYFKDLAVKAVINKQGIVNWDIVKQDSVEVQPTQVGEGFVIKKMRLRKCVAENARIAYSDYATRTFLKLDSLDLTLRAGNDDEKTIFSVDSKSRNLRFSRSGVQFIKGMNSALQAKVFYNKKEQTISFKESAIRLNDIDFIMNGRLTMDSVRQEVYADVDMGLKVPSLQTLWEALPEKIFEKDQVAVQGKVALNATVKGIYARGRLPVTDIVFQVRDGALTYKDFPGAIKKMEADVHSVINFDTPAQSRLNVKKLYVEGMGLYLNGTGDVTDIINDPSVKANIKGDIDFTKLQEVFPLQDSIVAKGIANIDINTLFKVNQVMKSNFNGLQVGGKIELKDLLINDPKDSLYFETPSTLIGFGRHTKDDNRRAGAKIVMEDCKLVYKAQHDIKLKGLNLQVRARKLSDSMSGLEAEADFTHLKYMGVNKMKGLVRKAHATATLTRKGAAKYPLVHTTFTIDSAGVWYQKQFVGIGHGNYEFDVEKKADNKWLPNGYVEFNHLKAFSRAVGIPLLMEHSRVTINDRSISLRNAHFTIGRSDLMLTGRINNVLAKNTDSITASLKLFAHYIDANQLMQIFNRLPDAGGDSTAVADINDIKAADTTLVVSAAVADTNVQMRVFKVPEKIRFRFMTHIDSLRMGDLDIRDISGLLKMEDGQLKLSGFKLKTLAANLETNMNYIPESDKEARVDFDFNLTDIEMANLARLMPALDTLFPMVRSFEGKVHFRMQGTARLDPSMQVIVPSVSSVAALQAKDIMVMDGETFRELAKTFKFKNREKNPIDTLNMEMIIEKSHLEVLPALVEIDRYRLAVGGVQNIDLSYDYHISVLKSPIPFKTGVEVRGSNLDDYKISLVKAKYKYYFSDKERLQEKADTTILNKKKEILSKLGFE